MTLFITSNHRQSIFPISNYSAVKPYPAMVGTPLLIMNTEESLCIDLYHENKGLFLWVIIIIFIQSEWEEEPEPVIHHRKRWSLEEPSISKVFLRFSYIIQTQGGKGPRLTGLCVQKKLIIPVTFISQKKADREDLFYRRRTYKKENKNKTGLETMESNNNKKAAVFSFFLGKLWRLNY